MNRKLYCDLDSFTANKENTSSFIATVKDHQPPKALANGGSFLPMVLSHSTHGSPVMVDRDRESTVLFQNCWPVIWTTATPSMARPRRTCENNRIGNPTYTLTQSRTHTRKNAGQSKKGILPMLPLSLGCVES